MTKNFNRFYNKLPAKRRARIEARVAEALKTLALGELRKARAITQMELARRLRTNQGAISKLEKRADMYLSTLEDVVRAMGGRLELRAVFPGGETSIVAPHRRAAARRR